MVKEVVLKLYWCKLVKIKKMNLIQKSTLKTNRIYRFENHVLLDNAFTQTQTNTIPILGKIIPFQNILLATSRKTQDKELPLEAYWETRRWYSHRLRYSITKKCGNCVVWCQWKRPTAGYWAGRKVNFFKVKICTFFKELQLYRILELLLFKEGQVQAHYDSISRS